MDETFSQNMTISSTHSLRNDFAHDLEERLYTGCSVTLTAPRHVGTTLAHEVLRRLKERGCYTTEIDLLPICSIAEWARELMKQYLQLRIGDIGLTWETVEGLLGVLSRADVQEKIQDVVDVTYLAQLSAWELVDEATELAQRIAETDGKRLVVWFNEWQDIVRIGGDLLLKRLRAMFQFHSHVSYAFVGRDPDLMRALFADRYQAFYRFAVELKVPE